MTDNLFGLLFLLPLPLWLAMLLFPRTTVTARLVSASWPFMALGALQLVLVLAALFTVGAGAAGISTGSVRALLASDAGLLALWLHLLTLNLFTGVWIFRDARYWGMTPTGYLLATLLLGPVGLASYLFLRRRSELRDPVRDLN